MSLTVATRSFDATPATRNNIGSLPSTVPGGLTADELGDGINHQTVLNFTTGFYVVTGNTTGASFGSQAIYTFPEGRINIVGCTAKFSGIFMNTQTGSAGDIASDGAGSGDYSIGSTATADATLSSTDVNILLSSAMLDPFVAGAGSSNAGTALAASAQLDGTSTAITAYLNVIIDDADVADGAASDKVYFIGTVRVTWSHLGDY